jgi:hypothetical protein
MFKKILLAAVFSAIFVVPNVGAHMPFPSCPCDKDGNRIPQCFTVWGYQICA